MDIRCKGPKPLGPPFASVLTSIGPRMVHCVIGLPICLEALSKKKRCSKRHNCANNRDNYDIICIYIFAIFCGNFMACHNCVVFLMNFAIVKWARPCP